MEKGKEFTINRREFLKKMGDTAFGVVVGSSLISRSIFAKPITKEDKYPEDLAERISQLEKELQNIDAEINATRTNIKGLYKARRKDALDEIIKLKEEIDNRARVKGHKKDILIALSIFQQYTEESENGGIRVKENIPKIDDIEITEAQMTLEGSCEDLTTKKDELIKLYERIKNGEDVWTEIEKNEEETETLETEGWQRGDAFVTLRATSDLSNGMNISITSLCSSPGAFLPNGVRYFSSFSKTQVWVGMYSTNTPNPNYMIDQYCTLYYTTDVNYYWNVAKSRPKGPQTNSIQVKWFYVSLASYDSKWHDLIWEANKNSSSTWYTYAPYNTTNPSNGNYGVQCYSIGGVCQRILVCCNYHWCNNHCGGCFACDDADATQHFVTQNP